MRESVGGKQLAIDSNRGKKIKIENLLLSLSERIIKKTFYSLRNAFSMSHRTGASGSERNSLSQPDCYARQTMLLVYLSYQNGEEENISRKELLAVRKAFVCSFP